VARRGTKVIVPFVIDASVVASWHFEDERSAEADRILDAIQHDRAVVPAHWWFEVRNVVLMGERRGRASPQQSTDFLVRLSRLPVDTAALPDDTKVLAMARQHRLTFYDAAYLELAVRETVALATLDLDRTRAAKAEKVPLLI